MSGPKISEAEARLLLTWTTNNDGTNSPVTGWWYPISDGVTKWYLVHPAYLGLHENSPLDDVISVMRHESLLAE